MNFFFKLFYIVCIFSKPVLASTELTSISLYGTPKYSNDFKNFDYVTPNAPKGGAIRLAIISGFDNFNPYPMNKITAEGVYLTYDSLLKRSLDEPLSSYPRIASTFTLSDDESWVIFKLNPKAKFHDQTPISTNDVAKTFEAIQKAGPFTFREAFKEIDHIDIISTHEIKFTFKTPNQRALVLFIGFLPILPAKDLEKKDLTHFATTPSLANGPYKVSKYEFNKFVEYERVKDYWAQDLPSEKGHSHFDIIRFEYFRNYQAAFEAFKAGTIDLFQEEDIGHWLKNYNFPAAKKGHVQLKDIPHQRPNILGFVFNTRRAPFNDINVRKALSLALNVDSLNKNYFHDAYETIPSFFGNTDLAAPDTPSLDEIKLLSSYKDKISAELRNHQFSLPLLKHTEHRHDLSLAHDLLKESGFEIRQNNLYPKESKKPISFEILLQNPQYERLALSFKKSLEKLGITTHVRVVDAALYQKRLNVFDYDMIINNWSQSLAPHAEQMRYWGSKAAMTQGSANYAGIQHVVIDDLLEKLISQKSKVDHLTITHALDRILQSGYYFISLPQKTRDFVAYWNKFGHPKSQPVSAFPLLKWWYTQTWWQNETSQTFE
ncbi:MAG: extracellular solute-binding protein [Alphaproteobacteria bacterium]|nr:extracellular solute-binding protein [Alphaproteobacteria bacterium]